MENGKRIRVLTIRYTNDIKQFEVPAFRGAVNAAMGGEANILFHNHTENNYRYSYPLIQYKRLGGKAAIICVSEGTNVIGQFLATDSHELSLGDRNITLEIDSISPRQLMVQTWQSSFTYSLRRWIPLNAENYQKYIQSDSIIERANLLENILIGNLLSLAKGLQINVDEQIKVNIKKISEPYTVKNKGVKLMAFDLEFVCNMSIPNYLGIGKNTSIGFGIVTMINDKNKKHKDN